MKKSKSLENLDAKAAEQVRLAISLKDTPKKDVLYACLYEARRYALEKGFRFGTGGIFSNRFPDIRRLLKGGKLPFWVLLSENDQAIFRNELDRKKPIYQIFAFHAKLSARDFRKKWSIQRRHPEVEMPPEMTIYGDTWKDPYEEEASAVVLDDFQTEMQPRKIAMIVSWEHGKKAILDEIEKMLEGLAPTNAPGFGEKLDPSHGKGRKVFETECRTALKWMAALYLLDSGFKAWTTSRLLTLDKNVVRRADAQLRPKLEKWFGAGTQN